MTWCCIEKAVVSTAAGGYGLSVSRAQGGGKGYKQRLLCWTHQEYDMNHATRDTLASDK
jgi:hypothetical protein